MVIKNRYTASGLTHAATRNPRERHYVWWVYALCGAEAYYDAECKIDRLERTPAKDEQDELRPIMDAVTEPSVTCLSCLCTVAEEDA